MAKRTGKEISVDELPGIGTITAEKLKESGYRDIMSVATAAVGEMMEKTGVSEVVAKKAIDFAREHCDMGFVDAEEFQTKRERIFKIKTGSESIDKMLDGGFESGVITELAGAFACGKTQLAHQAAINVFRDLKGMSVYIDTESTFRPGRIIEMAKALGLDEKEAMKHIKIGRAYNTDHQMLLAEKVEKMITEEKLPIKLLVVDSLTAHFRGEFIGRGTLSERQGKLNRHVRFLSRIADIYNIPIIVTNQVTTDLNMFFGDPTTPIGGHIVGHSSVFRVMLRRGKKGSRVGKIIDGPVAEGEGTFYITPEGIKDV